MEQAKYGRRFLVVVKVTIESFLRKQNKTTQRAYERNCNWKKAKEGIMPLGCRAQFFF